MNSALCFAASPVKPEESHPTEPVETYVTGTVLHQTPVLLNKGPLSLIPAQAGEAGLTEETAERLEIQLTSGPEAGQRIQLENILSGHPAYDIQVKPGQSVLLYVDPPPNADEPPIAKEMNRYHLADHVRSPVISLYFVVFLAVLSWLFGRQAWLWLLGLGAFLFILLSFTLPIALDGKNPMLLLVLTSLFLWAPLLWPLRERLKDMGLALSTLGLSLTLTTVLFLTFCHLSQCLGFLNETIANLWQPGSNQDFTQLLLSLALPASGMILLAQTVETAELLEQADFLTEETPWQACKKKWTFYGGVFTAVSLSLLVFPALDLTHTDINKLINLESAALQLGLLFSVGLSLVVSGPISYGLFRRFSR